MFVTHSDTYGAPSGHRPGPEDPIPQKPTMELLIRITTGEALTVAEAAELAEASRREHVPLNQLATDFIREGLQRRRAAAFHNRRVNPHPPATR